MATQQEKLQAQLDAAKQRLDQLKARQAKLRARERAAEARQRRAEDTRRKILIGAYVLGKRSEAEVRQMMDDYLTEERDRRLFGLESNPGGADAPGAHAPQPRPAMEPPQTPADAGARP